MPPEERFVPRFAAEPPLEELPYGRWAERLSAEFLAACLALVQDTERKIEALRAERAAIDRELLTRPAIPAADFFNLGRYRTRAGKEELELGEERRQRLQSAAEQRARVQQAQQRVRPIHRWNVFLVHDAGIIN